MKDCDHVLGFLYGEEYGSFCGSIVELSDLRDLSLLKKLKSEHGEYFNFCPNCGVELKSLVEEKIKQVKKEETLLKKKNQKDKEKKEKAFNLRKNKYKSHFNFNELDSTKIYHISINSKNDYDTNNIIMTGNIDHLAKSLSQYYGHDPKSEYYLNEIFECPSLHQFEKACLENNWEGSLNFFRKKIKDKNVTLDLTKEGVCYLSITDINGKNNYRRLSVITAIQELDLKINLKKIDI